MYDVPLVMVQLEKGWILPKALVPHSQTGFCMILGKGWHLSKHLFPA